MIGRRIYTIWLSVPLVAIGSTLAQAELPTTPQNAVRSLHHIQDAIARGDAAAFRLQTQMLKVIDELLASAGTEARQSAEYRNAVLAYAVSGGNPATFGALYDELTQRADEQQMQIARTVSALLRRRPLVDDKAPDPLAVGGMLGGGMALLYGLNASNPEKQADHLRAATLIAPGTLIEESALRRLMPILTEAGQHNEFLSVASRYARTFVNSPYASDFAVALVEGGTRLKRAEQFGLLADVFGFMPAAHRRSIVSRQMRAATIGGNFELVRFLKDKLADDIEVSAPQPVEAAESTGEDDTMRQRLYALMAGITSTNHADVAAELAAIDVAALPLADQRLLAVARAVVDDIVRPVSESVVGSEAGMKTRKPVRGNAMSGPADPVSGDMIDLPQQPSEVQVRTVLPGPTASEEVRKPDAPALQPSVSAASMPSKPDVLEDGAHADFVSSAREALDRLDAVLQESTQ